MKLRGSLACLLLTLCLGSGAASPLQNGGEGVGASASQGMGDAISHGVGEAVGEGAKEAASSGIQDALGQGHGGEGGYALRGARGDAFDHRLGEAARSLGNAGNEVGRQAEDVIRRGIDAAHNSGSWGTSGGHGMFGSQGGFGGHGNPGGQGTPWASEGNFGTNSLGGSVGQGGDGSSFGYKANAQGAVAQPGYGAVRGNNQNSGCTNPPSSGSRESNSGGSSGGGGGNGGHDGSSGNSHSSSGNSHGSSGNSQGSSGHGSSGHGNGNQGNGGQGNSGSSSSGSRELETSNFDEGYSVSRGTGSSSGSRGGSGSGNKPECDNPGDDVRMAGGSRNQESRESSRLLGGSHDYQEHGSSGDGGRNEAVSGLKAMNSDPSSLPFNFDSFWENFKSKLGFINWDAINKGRLPPPSTRALLYFRRLWENFKRNTPFFNWKQIEGSDLSSLQKRAGGTDQFAQPEAARQEASAVTAKNYYNSQQGSPGYNWQYYAKTTAKGGVTPSSSSASRAQPGLLKWLKFW
ncbi:dermokine isoform X2 [Cricetulus griseus]|uniref:Dermokine isoform X2 n=3 Tax=Cricetulus griseus TaxID=10029 RepID=A0A9J7GKK1_CRIGR|nr:dermokine isoform X2 [Cricetulus griseus]